MDRRVVHRSYRYRVYPTKDQEKRLLDWESALRFLWNLANEQWLMGLSRPRDERVFPSHHAQQVEMTSLRAELPWLRDVPYDACGEVLRRLSNAWNSCLRRKARAPRWKRRGCDTVSITHPRNRAWRILGDSLHFPKIGELRVVAHRKSPGKPRSCTISRDGDQWFAIAVFEIEANEPTGRTSPVVALDRGLTYTLADSDGNLTPNPKFYEATRKRLARAQRAVSRRKKGSHRREKAKRKVMRLHRKVRRQREHFLHVESARLAKSHGVVVIEKLNVAGMGKARPFARHIADAGWSKFAEMLRYKLDWSGGQLVEVPAAYSSQTCAECGAVDATSRDRERFRCTTCGHENHADLNAAKVLKSRWSPPVLPVEASA